MWASEQDGNLVLSVELTHLTTGMIAGTIKQDDSAPSPVLVFLIKHPDKMSVEQLHGLAVGVALHQSHVDGT